MLSSWYYDAAIYFEVDDTLSMTDYIYARLFTALREMSAFHALFYFTGATLFRPAVKRFISTVMDACRKMLVISAT